MRDLTHDMPMRALFSALALTCASVRHLRWRCQNLCQALTVRRGLDGSTPAQAVAGSPLLAPVYVTTPKWGDGPDASGHLHYQADYASAYAWYGHFDMV